MANVVKDGGNWTHFELDRDQKVKVYGGKMDWRGEIFITCGVLALALAVILGITSLPSVAATMTWQEFTFIQSKLGWTCLILAAAHNVFYGLEYMDKPSCYIPPSFQYCLYLPGLAVLMKLPLLIPWVSSHLDKIRAGHVRGNKVDTRDSLV